jgi:DNA-binding response OmpR family regulator
MQLLIVEDEERIANLLRRGLVEKSFAVDIARDGAEAVKKVSYNEYDLIVLDLMIPKVDGLTVCRTIRKTNTSIPILILTAKDGVEDKVKGLDSGADDYMTKPFSFVELLARVRALLRRGKIADPVILQFGNLTMDPSTHVVTREGKKIALTTREYALLEYFLHNPNRVLSKSQILEHVWDYNYDGISNIVETYIRYLRSKIRVNKNNKELIHTVRGIGYMLKEED